MPPLPRLRRSTATGSGGFTRRKTKDETTLALFPHLSRELGKPIVVENRPGVGGVLALSEDARAAPDGYTLIVGNVGPLALAPNVLDKPPRDTEEAADSRQARR